MARKKKRGGGAKAGGPAAPRPAAPESGADPAASGPDAPTSTAPGTTAPGPAASGPAASGPAAAGPAAAEPASDDGNLVHRVAGGDAAALTALYDRHAGAVFSLALRIVGEEGEAGRVVQQVFGYAWQQAAGYDPARASVAGWLLETARGVSVDRTRAAKRAAATASAPQDGPAPAADESATLQLPSPARTQAHEVCTPEQAGRLRDALAALPALQRLAIELAYYEGLSLGEIAGQLEQPEATVSERLLTGLKSLRGALEDSAA